MMLHKIFKAPDLFDDGHGSFPLLGEVGDVEPRVQLGLSYELVAPDRSHSVGVGAFQRRRGGYGAVHRQLFIQRPDSDICGENDKILKLKSKSLKSGSFSGFPTSGCTG